MAYKFDAYDNSVVVDGFEAGIADDPYDGIADLKNINIISVPGEASVNFATSKISAPSVNAASITSVSTTDDTITFSSSVTIETGQAITITGSTLPAGIVAGTIYWIFKQTSTTAKLYTTYLFTSTVDITTTGTPGNWTFSTVNMNVPTNFTKDVKQNQYWMVDKLGQVWSNQQTTSQNNYWTYTGNSVPTSTFTNGNGIVFYQSYNSTGLTIGYIFVFHNSSIDYTSTDNTFGWVYQWNPSLGTALGYSATPTKRLHSSLTLNASHKAIVAPSNRVYYCDTNWIGRFYQTAIDVSFDPTSMDSLGNKSGIFNATPVLPGNDQAQCLAPIGSANNILIGAQSNVLYPWDTVGQAPSFTIFIAESNTVNMVTVNTNTFVFAGNRGRVYVTNGSQAQVFRKMPDHISGTVEPYYTWGGVASNKNQIYFSASVTDNAGNANSNYGGIWAIDLDTKAMRLINKLSYGTYLGYATAMIPISGTPAGVGLYAGWDSGASTYGIDTTTTAPYTGSQASIETDLIPIGTFDKPRDFTRVEYKLTKPMVSGESITIKWRKDFSQSYTTVLTDSTVGNFSLSGPVNFSNAQWVQFQIILNSTSSTPSYTRLKNIRILGLTGPSLSSSQQLSL